MILNCTQKTKDRFNIKYQEEFNDKLANDIVKEIIEKEKNDFFLNWGLKYFSFDRKNVYRLYILKRN